MRFRPPLADLLAGPGSAGEQPGGPKQVGHVPSGACPPHCHSQSHLLWSANASSWPHLLWSANALRVSPPRDDAGRRRGRTGGFAWRAASRLLGRLRQPSIRGRRRAGTPENGCAQATIEAWYRVDPSDRRLLFSPLQRRLPRTSPRCDVAVVSRVLLFDGSQTCDRALSQCQHVVTP